MAWPRSDRGRYEEVRSGDFIDAGYQNGLEVEDDSELESIS
jgi:hypothetical protein